ncbi:hypothetical protein C7M84_024596 [Penaeus vannamei]|uniref:Uncharacterized protein n=1 Tax=Penaeus vannamei TaxID=6689 RepID=A0A423U0K5_PENVA|nr:hypothetical protein C7M84_024596 [Penaeus vannamei]
MHLKFEEQMEMVRNMVYSKTSSYPVIHAKGFRTFYAIPESFYSFDDNQVREDSGPRMASSGAARREEAAAPTAGETKGPADEAQELDVDARLKDFLRRISKDARDVLELARTQRLGGILVRQVKTLLEAATDEGRRATAAEDLARAVNGRLGDTGAATLGENATKETARHLENAAKNMDEARRLCAGADCTTRRAMATVMRKILAVMRTRMTLDLEKSVEMRVTVMLLTTAVPGEGQDSEPSKRNSLSAQEMKEPDQRRKQRRIAEGRFTTRVGVLNDLVQQEAIEYLHCELWLI